MIAELTPEQRDHLKQHGDKPMPIVDPETNAIYFLVARDVFERVKVLLDDEPYDVRETYAAQSEVAGRSGWDDPEMDVYDDYEANKPQP